MHAPLLFDGVTLSNTRDAFDDCPAHSPEPIPPDEVLQHASSNADGALEDASDAEEEPEASAPREYFWGRLPSDPWFRTWEKEANADDSKPAEADGEVNEVELSGKELVDSILEGTKWGDGTPGTGTKLTFSFKTEDTMAIAPSTPKYAEKSWVLDDDQKQAVRDALAEWSKVANIHFEEVEESEDTQGDLRFGGTYNTPKQRTAEAAPLLAGDTPENGDIWLGNDFKERWDESSQEPGSFEFMAIMHEIGHTLGLKHPHHTSPDNDLLTPKESDNQRQTLMSYTLDYSVSPSGPQPLDIAAIQYLYGPNTEYNKDDTVYRFDPDTPVFRSIWDAGGINTLDASNQTTSVRLDLNETARSSIGPLIEDNNFLSRSAGSGNDYLTLASGTLIHGAIGSPEDDYIWGNSLDNVIEGGPGDDDIYGNSGRDTAIYRITDKPQETRLIEDETISDFWHVVDGKGRNLLEIRRTWDNRAFIVEDVREDKDIPEGEAQLGKDVLEGVEVIDWSLPLTEKS